MTDNQGVALNTQLIQYIMAVQPIHESEIQQLNAVFTRQTLRKNEIFLRAGERLSQIGFNLNGVFRYFYVDYNGNEKTKYFVKPNDFVLSLSAFIEDSPSLYSIQALDECEILTIPVQVLKTLIETSHPLQKVYRYILENTYVAKENREAEFLMCDAKQRYLCFIREFPDIVNKVKLHHIASYLGIAPESLSRIRSQMQSLNKGQ